MSVMVSELYSALRQAGVDEELAQSAARAVIADVATKADLETLHLSIKAEMLELKADITWRMLLMTGAFIAAVGALKVFA